jgi:glycosyltransferase involved in cell wall biosynthesis
MSEPDRRGPAERPLRIGIDAHAIGERKTGNERFIANLIPAIRARCDHELVVYVTNDEAERSLAGARSARTAVRRLRPATPFVRVPIGLPLRAARDGLDVLLVQYEAGPVVPCPVVPVVHDVAFWRHPAFFSPFERAWMRRAIPWTIRRAAHVVTVSAFSRDEIVDCFGIEPSRIEVALEAADPVFARPPGVPAGIEPPYVLAVGNLEPRKNLGVLISAFRRLPERAPEVRERLVLVGQQGFRAGSIRAEAADLVASGRVTFTGYVSDERLVALLAGATAFAFPSLYEGFGLPVVEAMAAGAPTLASDIPVMREVAGDAAVLLPTRDPDAWAEAIAELSRDPARRSELAEHGRRRAAGYSWKHTADAVLRALEVAARR